MKTILDQLEARRAGARLGGGEARIASQHAKGKLTARERIDVLLGHTSDRQAAKERLNVPGDASTVSRQRAGRLAASSPGK